MLLVSCQKSAEETTSSELPESTEILNGNPISASEYPSVGLVKADKFICSGTLIASDIVLTANHCVVDDNGNLIPLKFTLDARLSNTNNWVNVTSVRRYSTRDMAILKLAQSFTAVEPSEVSMNSVTQSQLNQVVEIVGYGNSQTSGSGSSATDSGAGTKRKGTSVLSGFSDSNYSLVSKRSNNQIICPGDSGGPLFFNSQGRRLLFGVANSVLWRGSCVTVSESYHSHVSYGLSKSWLLNNLAFWAKRVSVFRGVNNRGNYFFTRRNGEGTPTYTYPLGATPAFKLLEVPSTFSNASCGVPLVRCRNSSGMNYLATQNCGTNTFEKTLGYACQGNRNSQSPSGSFDLYRVDNSSTGASISLSYSDATTWVQRNRGWRIVGFQGVYVLPAQ